MVMKKPFKIFLADLVHNYFPGNYTVPLNIANIAAYAEEKMGGDFHIEIFKFPGELLKALKKERPDILGLSNYFWNNDLNFQIGARVKKDYPDTTIVMGGPSIRIDDKGMARFLKVNNFVDFYAMFEGEAPFLNLLEAFTSEGAGNIGNSGKGIEGCAYLIKGDLVYRKLGTPLDLNKLPSPYLKGLLDRFIKMDLTPLFESNRGCPFSCTFCTWGISAQKKLRVFPLDKVFAEMEYVAALRPESAYWIFADANFGILERDVSIAEKIGQIKRKNPSLKMIEIWASKNTTERNIAIARHINESKRQVLSVQTLDKNVEKIIKRSNIDEAKLKGVVGVFKSSGVEVLTDVLCGLPGETAESHLGTLRKCFDTGFDSIEVGNVYLLPGSEMETPVSRKDYRIKSKYRLRQGSYGFYDGIISIESEEVIRSTSAITESEMSDFRILHWLVWYSWNSNFLKPLLSYLRELHNVHPVDFLMHVINTDKHDFEAVKDIFGRFQQEAGREWFNSARQLKSFYTRKDRLREILDRGTSKMNFRYTAELILNPALRAEFYDFIAKLIPQVTGADAGCADMISFLKEAAIAPDEVFKGMGLPRKELWVKKESLPFILRGLNEPVYKDRKRISIVLYKEQDEIALAKKLLDKYSFGRNKIFAVEKTLENSVTIFSYGVKLNENSFDKSELRVG